MKIIAILALILGSVMYFFSGSVLGKDGRRALPKALSIIVSIIGGTMMIVINWDGLLSALENRGIIHWGGAKSSTAKTEINWTLGVSALPEEVQTGVVLSTSEPTLWFRCGRISPVLSLGFSKQSDEFHSFKEEFGYHTEEVYIVSFDFLNGISMGVPMSWSTPIPPYLVEVLTIDETSYEHSRVSSAVDKVVQLLIQGNDVGISIQLGGKFWTKDGVIKSSQFAQKWELAKEGYIARSPATISSAVCG